MTVRAMGDAELDTVPRRLVEAGVQILAAGAHAAMPLRAVAARAGTTTGAIQHHFGDKRGLLLAIMRHHGQRTVERLRRLERTALPPADVRIKRILLEFLPLDAERRDECIVADVFEGVAIHDETLARAFRHEYATLAKLIADQLPPARATHAEHLLAFVGGLRTELLLQRITSEDAIALLDDFVRLVDNGSWADATFER